MSNTQSDSGLSRRALFKYGLLGSLAIAAGVGIGSSVGFFNESALAPGMRVLRVRDLYFLRALLPTLLKDAASPDEMTDAVEKTLSGMDYSLSHLSPAVQGLTNQLMASLSLPLSRVPLTGIWGRWNSTNDAELQQFLQRWRQSSVALLKMGHNSLLQLSLMGWYGNPTAWTQCGYPGPPTI